MHYSTVRSEEEGIQELMKLPGISVGRESNEVLRSNMKICLIISNDYGEKIVENLMNRRGHCNICLEKCIGKLCKYGKYDFTHNIHIIRVPSIHELPEVLDEPEKILENKIPEVDLVIAMGIHNDLYLALPEILHKKGIRALIIFRGSPLDAPPGVVREVIEQCNEFKIEVETVKPPCLLTPKKSKPVISKFIKEFRIGYPVLEVKVVKMGSRAKIEGIEVKTSTPCGATWYIARMMLGYEVNLEDEKSVMEMCRYVASLLQSYCIASSACDYELGDTVIHWATYISIESYLRALNLKKELKYFVKERIRRKIT